MPNSLVKKALFLDLSSKTFELKTFSDYGEYLGGMGLGLKLFSLYHEADPVIFAVGPLNGFFPYASKTAVILQENGVVEDVYLGGVFSMRLRFGGIDALVVTGSAKNLTVVDVLNDSATFESFGKNMDLGGLPGKKSVLRLVGEHFVLDDYFVAAGGLLGRKMKSKNVGALVVTGSRTFPIENVEKYKGLYQDILKMADRVDVPNGKGPSCGGCPLGCDNARFGEMGGNILSHCLVACDYACRIYSDANVVFSCLNVLGYPYKHEDLEKVPILVENLIKEL